MTLRFFFGLGKTYHRQCKPNWMSSIINFYFHFQLNDKVIEIQQF